MSTQMYNWSIVCAKAHTAVLCYVVGKYFTEQKDFWLLCETHGAACVNIFMLYSTWLTVAMAVSRYQAICNPLRARHSLGMKSACIAIFVVFIFSIILNLPQFWNKKVGYIQDLGYFADEGWLAKNKMATLIYDWLYFLLGLVLPLVILVYCNMFLIRALHKSIMLRRKHSRPFTSKSVPNSTNVMTLILVIIVIFYVVLVVPVEVLRFFKIQMSVSANMNFNLAVAVCNTLQAFNFAINFILYCIINVHFRKVIKEFILCTALCEHLLKRNNTRFNSDVLSGQTEYELEI